MHQCIQCILVLYYMYLYLPDNEEKENTISVKLVVNVEVCCSVLVTVAV